MPDLLIELFSEEIPARMQARAADDLRKLVTDGLVDAGLTYAGAKAFVTPRRLALSVHGLPTESPAVREERKGPKADAAENALNGFLRATGLTKDELEVRDAGKGQVWFATIERDGRPASDIVGEVLEATIRSFPWPKSMRWGSGTLRWVRPLHGILCILYDEAGPTVVPVEVDGLSAGDLTEGHRFMSPGAFAVTSFDDYTAKLRAAHVILDPEERAAQIKHHAENLAFASGKEVAEDKGLLAEVAGLVEWPVVLMGEIGADYLSLPSEVLQTSMREHQKFFSVRSTGAEQIDGFITVANRTSADTGATILAGNDKVLSARLADAKFFWENDLRVARAGMGDWLAALDNVTFHARLGSVGARIARTQTLARRLAPACNADPETSFEAARVAKADLASEMVYEFPELQGVMGRYYALEAGLDEAIADAARDHYAPLGPSDAVPGKPVSVAVALADKLDALTGFWAIDEKPTGSKDPFALRRAALGVIRTLLENDIRLSLGPVLSQGLLRHAVHDALGGNADKLVSVLDELLDDIADFSGVGASVGRVIDRLKGDGLDLEEAASGLLDRVNGDIAEKRDDLLAFLHDRLKVYMRDRGIRHDVIDACLAMPGTDDLSLLVKRAGALQAVLSTEDGENLIQGFKRANNILAQAEEKDGVEYSYGPDAKLAQEPEETVLFDALAAAEAAIGPAIETEDFGAAMAAMAALRAPIDGFFETVQVNAENAVLRRNRLNILHRIRAICLGAADLSRIEG
ncbi:MAG: glycine--tRNA ligase subunit beta [Pseudomonadota bacterium]